MWEDYGSDDVMGFISQTMESLELERVKQVQSILSKYCQLVETIVRPTEEVHTHTCTCTHAHTHTHAHTRDTHL